MTTYYVATLSCYVLVTAENETLARELGLPLLANLLGREMPITVRTVRPATSDEIALDRWHRKSIANEVA
jgi:hypothetical protein